MPKRFLFVLATFLLSVLLYVDRICISTAKDGITRELELSDIQFGWAMSAFALGYALFQTPTGLLADRFGPRRLLSGVVVLWSVFTGLTGVVRNLFTLIVVRFLFGAGEAGAFPGMARAVYSWMPMRERGVTQGINFSGSRLGAAFALPAIATLIETLGWRFAFGLLMLIGFVWAVGWYLWFRDDPTEHPGISDDEKSMILATRQQAEKEEDADTPELSAAMLLRSWNLWYAMIQYFCSNFTFFFCLTWLYPHLKRTYNLEAAEAGWYASAPLVCGALGNILAGWLVDMIYRKGHWKLSRQVPAILGFALAAGGLVASVGQESAFVAVAWLSVAIFGADMTLSPSWSFCIDIGGKNAGAVSGTMNMAGNIGSFVTGLAFPYIEEWTGSVRVFFYIGAALNVLAIFVWMLVKPERGLSGGAVNPKSQAPN